MTASDPQKHRRSFHNTWMMAALAGVALLSVTWPVAANDGHAPGFGAYWHDGQAELSGYRYTVTRYGQPRQGQAVLIYVTEPFRRSKNVKADNPNQNPADTFDAFKLNLVRDFQTGVYDYNTMASVFVRSSDFSPVKLSFTSAEWCGHVYEELALDQNRVTEKIFSYFEDESSSRTHNRPAKGVVEDNLFILLRGLRGAFLEPGQERSVSLLPGALYRRLTHQPLGWTTARIRRAHKPQQIETPAGEFDTTLYTIQTQQGRRGQFWIEMPYPHRVVQWSWQPAPVAGKNPSQEAAESGQLTGTVRLKYWQRHANGHEKHLEQLGLTPPPR